MNSMSLEHSDFAEIQRASEAVEELRRANTRKGTASGYFDDLNKMARAAGSLSGVGSLVRRTALCSTPKTSRPMRTSPGDAGSQLTLTPAPGWHFLD